MIKEPPGSAKQRIYALTLLAIICITVFFFGLADVGLIGPDEPRYAEVAREMFAGRDYISPRLCGCLWFEKPALLYWMAAASYDVFGVGEFGARVPTALSATASVLFIFLSVSRAVSTSVGLLAAVSLATTAIFIGYARAANMDMPLSASMCIALLSFHLASESDGSKRLAWWVSGSAAMGFSALAKGLPGVVLIVGILVVTGLLSGRRLITRWQEPVLGLAVFLAVAASWYLPVILRHGDAFIQEFFVNHHFKRYVRDRYHHTQPFYFFPAILIAGTLPWTFFLLPAITRLRRLKFRGGDARARLLLLAWVWVLVPLLFYSFSSSKLPGYILPVFPAASIIIAVELDNLRNGKRSGSLNAAVWLTAATSLVIAVGVLIYLRRESVSVEGIRVALVMIPLGFVALISWFAVSGKNRAFIAAMTGFTASLIAASAFTILPHLGEELSLKRLSLQAATALRPGEKIAFYLNKEYAPVFYAEGRVVCGTGYGDVLNALDPREIDAALDGTPSLIVITTRNWERDLLDRFNVEVIGAQGNETAFRVTRLTQ
jgi:4-amino-4-deoxy-L-arabinose transferase-like glycosyltransferase